MDFYTIKSKISGRGAIEVYPEFNVIKNPNLMVRGKSFYAIWDEEKNLWSTDEYDVQRIVDESMREYIKKYDDISSINIKWMNDFSSNSWVNFKKYVMSLSDNSKQLDSTIIFSNQETKRSDYASRKLPYPLEEGTYDAYDEIMSTLYDIDEREKLEWAIGSIIAGDSKKIQKFVVLYGAAGAGKSTVLNIIQKLFDGYYTTFEASSLVGRNNQFATEVFKNNPLVAIQHDGDLSRIEDNTKLNSIISHEEMVVNEKHKSQYSTRFNCFLFMATNRPVKITDAKSGIIRRLIDVRPSGRKIPPKRYEALMSQIDFELGAIASHCLEVYRNLGKNYYNSYSPQEMIYQTDFFFNFVEDQFVPFSENDGTTLGYAWEEYKKYCEDSGYSKMPKYKFREELKNYFSRFDDVYYKDSKQYRSYYSGFLKDKFSYGYKKNNYEDEHPYSLSFDKDDSLLDDILKDYPAQYANEKETPVGKWGNCKTKLKDLDTKKLHYVKVPDNMIIIDFDIKGEDGKKSFERNLEEASKWPKTYAELSKSGQGIHLHYIYDGDLTQLSRLYSENIEIKVFTGDSSLRRKVTKCNDIPIAKISSGLPLKGVKKVIDFDAVRSEKTLRNLIKRNLNKEIHPGTKPSIDFIFKILEDAYNSDLKYDITDMRPAILSFANNSTNQSDYCIKMVARMKFKSKEDAENSVNYDDIPITFFDVEVFPNLFVIVWKYHGANNCVRMINPSAKEVEELFKLKLVGFNNRDYDNHILYAASLGYSNRQLYELSKRIIDGSKNAKFGHAYNLSYSDIYDFASAGNKMSLKKWEIKLGIHHLELGFDWNKEVPENLWEKVAEYCENDVVSTEALFDHLQGDFLARTILADIAEGTVNDTTNSLTTKIIFGKDRNPQREFKYRDLSKPVKEIDDDMLDFLKEACPKMVEKPHGKEKSILPYFEGYSFEAGKSIYKGIEVGEGGRVYSKPGVYGHVALLDVASMHPHSAIAEVIFGVRFTRRFREITEGRVSIKHKAWDEINDILDGKLTKHIEDVKSGKITVKDLSNALKTAINAVYGLTAAKFDNAFKDKRNIDNIIAKRGALFMIDLQEEVEKRGFEVAHIKTDSIKIPDATPEIISFVMEFGERYGYTFEHEATYDKMCLVNDAVYIARYSSAETCEKLYGYVPGENASHGLEWTATGAQFAVPYVYKTLFTKEPIIFDDYCETKSVKTAIYLDNNENLPEEEHNYVFVGRVGSFVPVVKGKDGGLLMAERGDKYTAVTGTKGYRWYESEVIRDLPDKEELIDFGYFRKLVDDAVDSISKYVDFDWFVSDKEYNGEWPFDIFMNKPEMDQHLRPCGLTEEQFISCYDCPDFKEGKCNKGYDTSSELPFT